jgi:hypothetical protein
MVFRHHVDGIVGAELTDLNRILLNLARSRDFPNGPSRRGYDFIAPLDPRGHIDPILRTKYRDYCRVRPSLSSRSAAASMQTCW